MKELKIDNITALNTFIRQYFNTNKELVFNVVGNALDCIVIDLFNEEQNIDEFILKVNKHYQFLKELPYKSERPIFLLNEPTLDFDIKHLYKNRL